jgi:two-component system cell cycle response regulator
MRVLIADDSPAHLLALQKAVKALGHECLVAKDGDEAWERFNAETPEVVISDWVMPGIEGDELCRRIRDADGPYCYVIVLTSLDDKKHVMRGMKAGADDYLTKPLDSDDLEARLAAAARVTALHTRLAKQQEELERLRREQAALARKDALTGIANRLRMQEDLDAIDSKVSRGDLTGYALLMCDVDRFKAYNDQCGHQRGDQVLRSVAEAIAGACRGGDAVYRYGGEEFAVILQEREGDVARKAAERVREAVHELGMPHPATESSGTVTISVGVAWRPPGASDGWEPIVKRADEALYRAKDQGRDRVVLAEPAGNPTTLQPSG